MSAVVVRTKRGYPEKKQTLKGSKKASPDRSLPSP